MNININSDYPLSCRAERVHFRKKSICGKSHTDRDKNVWIRFRINKAEIMEHTKYVKQKLWTFHGQLYF